MNKIELLGIIRDIKETQKFGPSNFVYQKRELILKTFGNFQQIIAIDFIRENVIKLDNFKIGQNVKVEIHLRGRKYIRPDGEYKFYNSFVGQKINEVKVGEKVKIDSEPCFSI